MKSLRCQSAIQYGHQTVFTTKLYIYMGKSVQGLWWPIEAHSTDVMMGTGSMALYELRLQRYMLVLTLLAFKRSGWEKPLILMTLEQKNVHW